MSWVVVLNPVPASVECLRGHNHHRPLSGTHKRLERVPLRVRHAPMAERDTTPENHESEIEPGLLLRYAQSVSHVGVAFFFRDLLCCAAVIVFGIRIRAVFQQQVDHGAVPLLRGGV
jgi:hypothetical protein